MLNFLSPKIASDLSQSEEYISFRSTIPQKKVQVDDDPHKVWTLYDAGPHNISCPVFCLPPVSGTADIFFRQLMALSSRGYRVISVHYPIYWTMKEWFRGFTRLLDELNLDKVHIFGSSLGGFLAQKFAEFGFHSQRVHSLILCNTFTDTSIFRKTDSATLFWCIPALVLKRMIMGNFPSGPVDPRIADSVDFLVEKLEGLSQPELASRLTLNCMNCYVQPHKLRGIPITILDVFDESALSQSVREGLFKMYPEAKRAHLKSGGNFPFLSRSDEVNLHILVHLRQFRGTQYSACEELPDLTEKDLEVPSSSQPQELEMVDYERSL